MLSEGQGGGQWAGVRHQGSHPASESCMLLDNKNTNIVYVIHVVKEKITLFQSHLSSLLVMRDSQDVNQFSVKYSFKTQDSFQDIV